MAKNNHTAKTAGKAPKTAGASVQTADVSMQVGNESPDLQPAPDTEPAAGKEAEPTPSVPEAPDTTPGLRPDSASDDESGTADRQTDDTPATAGEDERPLSAVTAFADTPEELAARQAAQAPSPTPQTVAAPAGSWTCTVSRQTVQPRNRESGAV